MAILKRLALFALGFGMAYARNLSSPQKKGPVYVSPSYPVKRGRAPGMKAQLLSGSGEAREYAVIFGDGDEAFSGLLDFADRHGITAAHFTAIGALRKATLAWFDPQKKMYKKIPIEEQSEVLSMVGDIAEYKGRPAVHAHMVAGLSDGTTRGGHVIEAQVFPTLEVMVTVDSRSMHKRLTDMDLALIWPEEE